MRAKSGDFFEYSAALPRAESAEAAGSFRDQGLTGERPLAARRTAGLARSSMGLTGGTAP